MNSAAAIDIRDNREKTRFEAAVEGQIAFVDYNLVANGIVIAHTEVPKALEGRGIAAELFRAALAFARQEGRRVIPVCPVFAVWIQRHPEMHDLIDPSFRRSLGLPPIDAPAA
jgi:predicted GNAT family acetyltransferase